MLSYDRARPVLLSRFRGAPLCRIGVSTAPQITASIAHDDAPARSLRPNPKRVQAKRTRKVSRARVILELATRVSDRARYFALERRTAWSIAFDAS